jgi:hypothetical protein
MPGGFTLPNVTVGGGSQFTAQLMQLLEMLGQQRNVRAGLGSDLFSNLMGAQLEAQRRPISLVDQLLMSAKFGSVMPLSQGGEAGRAEFTSRPQSNLMSDLQRRLEMFTVGALTPQQQVSEGFDPATGVRLSQTQRDFIRALSEQSGRTPGQFADEPRRLQFGGRLRIDPNRAISTPSTVAGPASVVDRTGRRVALMGEAGRPETLSVSPGVRGGIATTAGDQGEAPGQERPNLRADQQIRFDEITRVRPELPFEVRVAIAQRPGQFEEWIGVQTGPRTAAARLVGGAIAADRRFSPTMLSPLARGLAPGPEQMTARDFTMLPPDMQQALMSAIGPDLFTQWAFELSGATPTGRRTGIAGPVRMAA